MAVKVEQVWGVVECLQELVNVVNDNPTLSRLQLVKALLVLTPQQEIGGHAYAQA